MVLQVVVMWTHYLSGAEADVSSSSRLSDASDHTPCNCQCCTDPSTPYHPQDVSRSGVVHTHHTKESGVKSYSRHIQTAWYKSFPWISVCSTSLRIFCSICCAAKMRGLLTFPKHYKSAFVEDGFKNLKKALERFSEHERSVMHQEATLKLAATASTSA